MGNVQQSQLDAKALIANGGEEDEEEHHASRMLLPEEPQWDYPSFRTDKQWLQVRLEEMFDGDFIHKNFRIPLNGKHTFNNQVDEMSEAVNDSIVCLAYPENISLRHTLLIRLGHVMTERCRGEDPFTSQFAKRLHFLRCMHLAMVRAWPRTDAIDYPSNGSTNTIQQPAEKKLSINTNVSAITKAKTTKTASHGSREEKSELPHNVKIGVNLFFTLLDCLQDDEENDSEEIGEFIQDLIPLILDLEALSLASFQSAQENVRRKPSITSPSRKRSEIKRFSSKKPNEAAVNLETKLPSLGVLDKIREFLYQSALGGGELSSEARSSCSEALLALGCSRGGFLDLLLAVHVFLRDAYVQEQQVKRAQLRLRSAWESKHCASQQDSNLQTVAMNEKEVLLNRLKEKNMLSRLPTPPKQGKGRLAANHLSLSDNAAIPKLDKQPTVPIADAKSEQKTVSKELESRDDVAPDTGARTGSKRVLRHALELPHLAHKAAVAEYDALEAAKLQTQASSLELQADAEGAPLLRKLKIFRSLRQLVTTTAPSEALISGQALVEDERQVHTCGQNSYGELAHGDTTTRKLLTQVTFLANKEFVMVAGGNEHTVLLTDLGEVYTAGYNDNGQCGQGSTARVGRLSLVEGLKDKFVTQVHAYNGCEHTLCVTDDGELYTFGYNYRGQLGHGNTTSISTPRLVRGVGGPGRRVTYVSCSYYHTAVSTSNGELYTFGRNDFGQLGHGDTADRKEPCVVEHLPCEHITSVACGQYHTIVAVNGGNVFVCGKNDYGQLGFETPESYRRPTALTVFGDSSSNTSSSSQAQSNSSCSLQLSSLAINNSGGLLNSKHLRGKDDHLIVEVRCGYYHTLALAESGRVWSFGRNDYGQLGIGTVTQKIFGPQVVAELDSKGIIRVAAGCYHSIAISNTGVCYVFGRNNHGQLGSGDTTERHSPYPIDNFAGRRVAMVAAGFYHTIFLTGGVEDKKSHGEQRQQGNTPLSPNYILSSEEFSVPSSISEVDVKVDKMNLSVDTSEEMQATPAICSPVNSPGMGLNFDLPLSLGELPKNNNHDTSSVVDEEEEPFVGRVAAKPIGATCSSLQAAVVILASLDKLILSHRQHQGQYPPLDPLFPLGLASNNHAVKCTCRQSHSKQFTSSTRSIGKHDASGEESTLRSHHHSKACPLSDVYAPSKLLYCIDVQPRVFKLLLSILQLCRDNAEETTEDSFRSASASFDSIESKVRDEEEEENIKISARSHQVGNSNHSHHPHPHPPSAQPQSSRSKEEVQIYSYIMLSCLRLLKCNLAQLLCCGKAVTLKNILVSNLKFCSCSEDEGEACDCVEMVQVLREVHLCMLYLIEAPCVYTLPSVQKEAADVLMVGLELFYPTQEQQVQLLASLMAQVATSTTASGAVNNNNKSPMRNSLAAISLIDNPIQRWTPRSPRKTAAPSTDSKDLTSSSLLQRFLLAPLLKRLSDDALVGGMIPYSWHVGTKSMPKVNPFFRTASCPMILAQNSSTPRTSNYIDDVKAAAALLSRLLSSLVTQIYSQTSACLESNAFDAKLCDTHAYLRLLLSLQKHLLSWAAGDVDNYYNCEPHISYQSNQQVVDDLLYDISLKADRAYLPSSPVRSKKQQQQVQERSKNSQHKSLTIQAFRSHAFSNKKNDDIRTPGGSHNGLRLTVGDNCLLKYSELVMRLCVRELALVLSLLASKQSDDQSDKQQQEQEIPDSTISILGKSVLGGVLPSLVIAISLFAHKISFAIPLLPRVAELLTLIDKLNNLLQPVVAADREYCDLSDKTSFTDEAAADTSAAGAKPRGAASEPDDNVSSLPWLLELEKSLASLGGRMSAALVLGNIYEHAFPHVAGDKGVNPEQLTYAQLTVSKDYSIWLNSELFSGGFEHEVHYETDQLSSIITNESLFSSNKSAVQQSHLSLGSNLDSPQKLQRKKQHTTSPYKASHLSQLNTSTEVVPVGWGLIDSERSQFIDHLISGRGVAKDIVERLRASHGKTNIQYAMALIQGRGNGGGDAAALDYLERIAFAAILKHDGLLIDSLVYSHFLPYDDTQTKARTFIPPARLRQAWRLVAELRMRLLRLRNKLKAESNTPREEQEAGESDFKKSFQQVCDDLKRRALFLQLFASASPVHFHRPYDALHCNQASNIACNENNNNELLKISKYWLRLRTLFWTSLRFKRLSKERSECEASLRKHHVAAKSESRSSLAVQVASFICSPLEESKAEAESKAVGDENPKLPDLNILYTLINRNYKRANLRSAGLHAFRQLILTPNLMSPQNDILRYLNPSLCYATFDELNTDNQYDAALIEPIVNKNKLSKLDPASQKEGQSKVVNKCLNSVSGHYTSQLGAVGSGTMHKVHEAFTMLYSNLSMSLRHSFDDGSAKSNVNRRLMLLHVWSMTLKRSDLSLLNHTGLLHTLQQVLSLERANGVSKEVKKKAGDLAIATRRRKHVGYSAWALFRLIIVQIGESADQYSAAPLMDILYNEAVESLNTLLSVSTASAKDNASDNGKNGSNKRSHQLIDQTCRFVNMEEGSCLAAREDTASSADFSLTMWVFLQQGSTGRHRLVLCRGREGAFAPLVLLRDQDCRLEVALDADYLVNNGAGSKLVSKEALKLNKWCHVAVVVEGSKVRLFLDGALDSQITVAKVPSQQIYREPFFVGKLPDAAIEGLFPDKAAQKRVRGGLEGLVSQMRYHTRALSPIHVRIVCDQGPPKKTVVPDNHCFQLIILLHSLARSKLGKIYFLRPKWLELQAKLLLYGTPQIQLSVLRLWRFTFPHTEPKLLSRELLPILGGGGSGNSNEIIDYFLVQIGLGLTRFNAMSDSEDGNAVKSLFAVSKDQHSNNQEAFGLPSELIMLMRQLVKSKLWNDGITGCISDTMQLISSEVYSSKQHAAVDSTLVSKIVGCLSLLGGHNEAIRVGCNVSLMHSDEPGTVVRYDIINRSAHIALKSINLNTADDIESKLFNTKENTKRQKKLDQDEANSSKNKHLAYKVVKMSVNDVVPIPEIQSPLIAPSMEHERNHAALHSGFFQLLKQLFVANNVLPDLHKFSDSDGMDVNRIDSSSPASVMAILRSQCRCRALKTLNDLIQSDHVDFNLLFNQAGTAHEEEETKEELDQSEGKDDTPHGNRLIMSLVELAAQPMTLIDFVTLSELEARLVKLRARLLQLNQNQSTRGSSRETDDALAAEPEAEAEAEESKEEEAEESKDEEEDISDLPGEMVEALMAMGFPQDWCATALRVTDLDIVAASTYIVDNLEALTRASEAKKKHKELALAQAKQASADAEAQPKTKEQQLIPVRQMKPVLTDSNMEQTLRSIRSSTKLYQNLEDDKCRDAVLSENYFPDNSQLKETEGRVNNTLDNDVTSMNYNQLLFSCEEVEYMICILYARSIVRMTLQRYREWPSNVVISVHSLVNDDVASFANYLKFLTFRGAQYLSTYQCSTISTQLPLLELPGLRSLLGPLKNGLSDIMLHYPHCGTGLVDVLTSCTKNTLLCHQLNIIQPQLQQLIRFEIHNIRCSEDLSKHTSRSFSSVLCHNALSDIEYGALSKEHADCLWGLRDLSYSDIQIMNQPCIEFSSYMLGLLLLEGEPIAYSLATFQSLVRCLSSSSLIVKTMVMQFLTCIMRLWLSFYDKSSHYASTLPYTGLYPSLSDCISVTQLLPLNRLKLMCQQLLKEESTRGRVTTSHYLCTLVELCSLLTSWYQLKDKADDKPFRLLEDVDHDDVVHQGIKCTGCGMESIKGCRYHCLQCPEDHAVDLCEACEEEYSAGDRSIVTSELHNQDTHCLLVIRKLIQPVHIGFKSQVKRVDNPLALLQPLPVLDVSNCFIDTEVKCNLCCSSCVDTCFKCANCPNYVICSNCENAIAAENGSPPYLHDHLHCFVKLQSKRYSTSMFMQLADQTSAQLKLGIAALKLNVDELLDMNMVYAKGALLPYLYNTVPAKPDDFSVTNLTHNSLTLTWLPTTVYGCRDTRYYVDVFTAEEMDDKVLSVECDPVDLCVTIEGLSASTEYVFEVYASNDAGDSDVLHLTSTTRDNVLFTFDTNYCGPNICISPDGLTANFNSLENWSTVLCTEGFIVGRNAWEVIVEESSTAYLFVGVASRETSLATFLGGDEHGWGYIGDRALYHRRNKVKVYGERFSQNDVIGVVLDMDNGTLSFTKNGIDLGVAVDGLSGKLYPAVAFYNPNQRVRLNRAAFDCSGLGVNIRHSPDDVGLDDVIYASKLLEITAERNHTRYPDAFIKKAYKRYCNWITNETKYYEAKLGFELEFDVSKKAAAMFGFIPGEKVQTPKGVGLVVGVADGKIWFLLENETTVWFFGKDELINNANQFIPLDRERGNRKPLDVASNESSVNELMLMNTNSHGVTASIASSRSMSINNVIPSTSVTAPALSSHQVGTTDNEISRTVSASHNNSGTLETETKHEDAVLEEKDDVFHTSIKTLSPSKSHHKNHIIQLDKFKELALDKHWGIELDSVIVAEVSKLTERDGSIPWNIPLNQLANTLMSAIFSSLKELGLKVNVDDTNREPLFDETSGEFTINIVNISTRLALLGCLNDYLVHLLPYVYTGSNGVVNSTNGTIMTSLGSSEAAPAISMASLAQKLRYLRGLVFLRTKKRLLRKLLSHTSYIPKKADDEYDYPEELPQLMMNRPKAAFSSSMADIETRLNYSLFGQAFDELHFLDANTLRIAYSHPMDDGQTRVFKIKFEGEGVDDYGGPYREVFAQFCAELTATTNNASGAAEAGHNVLQSTESSNKAAPTKSKNNASNNNEHLRCILPLLHPCANLQHGIGSNREKYVLKPTLAIANGNGSNLILEMYRFLGKLVGIALRTRINLNVDLASTIWKPLVSESLSSDDLKSIDSAAVSICDNILSLYDNVHQRRENNAANTTPEQQTYMEMMEAQLEAMCDELDWKLRLSDGHECQLIPAAGRFTVTPKSCVAYVQAVLKQRLCESEVAINAIKDGLSTVVPEALLPLFTWHEFEWCVCGSADVDIDLLRQCTEYDDDLSADDPHIQSLWRVLKAFDSDHKQRFLRFVWARSRLPATISDIKQKFKIQSPVGDGPRDRPDSYLPKAHTCFFSLNLPKYSSDEVMKEKLQYAIHNCLEMDADFKLSDAEMSGWS